MKQQSRQQYQRHCAVSSVQPRQELHQRVAYVQQREPVALNSCLTSETCDGTTESTKTRTTSGSTSNSASGSNSDGLK